MNDEELKTIDNLIRIRCKEIIGDKVEILVNLQIDRVMRHSLDEVISTAKEEATKQIAAKLLKLAIEETTTI